MKVEVTQAMIDEGKRDNCRACPIALALIRATGEAEVSVGWGQARIGRSFSPDCRFVSIPHEACLFIAAFDQGQEVAPFSFEAKGVYD